MAKDRRKLQHIHSSIADKQPTAASLEVGEIAVNNAENQEFLSIKNSGNKVVRFSSDAQMINWVERKEVIPYSGTVDNVHLDTNRSNIEIKLNQVVASATTKHNVVNGAKDIDGNLVNPTTDSGVTNGSGFAIDMSRYAMIGANPSFSSVTVTHRSNLSGTTNISNGAGGTALNITTTSVSANDTNWSETITNKKSTVTTEEDKITTLNESATTRTTKVGTENLTVSGTTTEVHTGNVTITNSANVSSTTNGTTTETKVGNVVENHSGTTTENKKGVVTENNLSDKTENTTGAHSIYSTGNTCINSQANANFYGKVNTNIGVACDGTTKGSATTIVGTTTLNMSGATTTISGNTTNVTGATTLNLSGNTTNKRALTANTTSTSAYTSATTATTIIGTANTSATTATISGTNLTINEANTVISSCTKVDIITNDLNIKQCTTGTVDFDFCNGFTVNSNNIKLHQCASAGTISISAQTQNINGGNLTINESGNTAINTTGTTNIKSTGNTNVETNGANNKVTIQASGTGGDVEVFAKDTLCMSGGSTAAMVGATKTNVGKNCSDGGQTTTLNLNGNTINETGATVNISGSSTANISGGTVNVSGGSICETASGTAAFVGATKTNIGANCSDGGNTATLNVRGVTTNISAGTITQTTSGNTTVNVGGNLTENVTGATTENHTGAVTINNASGYTAYTTGNTCITSSGNLTMGGDGNTNIGYDCAGAGIANNVNIYASTGVTVNAPTTTINGTLNVESSGLSKTLSWSYGDVRTAASDSTNFKDNKSFVMPKSVDHLTNYDGTNITLPHPVNVSGTVTATGAIYSSDRNLKENINFVAREDFNKVKNIFAKSFNFKDDDSKRKVYGVIAQEVKEAGLDELVHIKDDGMLGVDYTSLLILKCAYLEDFCAMLNRRILELEDKLNSMENKG